MNEQFVRTENLLGADAMKILSASRVAVFGIGGVGGHCVEALARSGVGEIDIIDNDIVSLSNINRQIFALHSTLGRYKVDVARERLLDIAPELKVNTHRLFYTPESADSLDLSVYDYIVDAIDTIAGKLEIIKRADTLGIPVISSMGAGNKLDPTAFEVADIYETSVCPLARVMRGLCRKNSIKKLKVVYSKEEAIKSDEPAAEMPSPNIKRIVSGSAAFVPSVVGLIIAGEVIKDLSFANK